MNRKYIKCLAALVFNLIVAFSIRAAVPVADISPDNAADDRELSEKYYQQGIAHYISGDYDKAMLSLSGAIMSYPRNWRARELMRIINMEKIEGGGVPRRQEAAVAGVAAGATSGAGGDYLLGELMNIKRELVRLRTGSGEGADGGPSAEQLEYISRELTAVKEAIAANRQVFQGDVDGLKTRMEQVVSLLAEGFNRDLQETGATMQGEINLAVRQVAILRRLLVGSLLLVIPLALAGLYLSLLALARLKGRSVRSTAANVLLFKDVLRRHRAKRGELSGATEYAKNRSTPRKR